MIINNFYVMGISSMPFKADAPTYVNADAVLAFSVSRQLFKMVRMWNTQILESFCSIQYFKFSSRNLMNTRRYFARELAVKEFFSLLARETF